MDIPTLAAQEQREVSKHSAEWKLVFIPLGITLNLALGTLTHLLRLPLYLDAVGTIVVTVLAGLGAGVATGVGSFLLGGVLTNPVLPWFSGTQAVIALYTEVAARRNGFKSFPRVALAGVGLGVVAAAVSAPIIAYLFAGVTGAGPSMITAFLLATGHTLLKSVFLSGVACEPVDKALQCILALWMLRGLPPRLLSKLISAERAGRFAKGRDEID
jgi:energy-coupling factor transport system substrate-specific component